MAGIIRPIEERRKEYVIKEPLHVNWLFVGLFTIGLSVSLFGLIKSFHRE